VRRLFDLSSPSHPIAADAEMTPETITRTGPGVVARELHSLNKQLSERFINLLTGTQRSVSFWLSFLP
jgi:hypothetical protein